MLIKAACGFILLAVFQVITKLIWCRGGLESKLLRLKIILEHSSLQRFIYLVTFNLPCIKV